MALLLAAFGLMQLAPSSQVKHPHNINLGMSCATALSTAFTSCELANCKLPEFFRSCEVNVKVIFF
jgi:hypothetical protein